MWLHNCLHLLRNKWHTLTYKSLISKAACESRSKKFFIIVTLKIRGSYILYTYFDVSSIIHSRMQEHKKKQFSRNCQLMPERVKYMYYVNLFIQKIWCAICHLATLLYTRMLLSGPLINEKHIPYKNISQEKSTHVIHVYQ